MSRDVNSLQHCVYREFVLFLNTVHAFVRTDGKRTVSLANGFVGTNILSKWNPLAYCDNSLHPPPPPPTPPNPLSNIWKLNDALIEEFYRLVCHGVLSYCSKFFLFNGFFFLISTGVAYLTVFMCKVVTFCSFVTYRKRHVKCSTI